MDNHHNNNNYYGSNFASSSSSSSASHYRRAYNPPNNNNNIHHNPSYPPPRPSLPDYPSTSSASSYASRRPNNMDSLLDDTPTAPPPPLPTASSSPTACLTSDPNFDIIDWHPAYQSCQRYFLDHAQHEPGTQALCALINIRLPYQWLANPVLASGPPSSNPNNSQFTFSRPNPSSSSSSRPTTNNNNNNSFEPSKQPPTFVSLLPYIRRLVITGFDKPPILHGFFGDSYKTGISPHLDCERRNYLFAAKQNGWRACQELFGGEGEETAPFMKPLEDASGEELAAAEKAWDKWAAVEEGRVNGKGGGRMNGNGKGLV